MVSPILFILAPLAAAFLMVFVNHKTFAAALALLVSAGLGALALSWLPYALQAAQPVVVAAIPAPLGIPLTLDALGTGLALIVAVSVLLVVLYSTAYMKDSHAPVTYYAVLMLLMTSSFGLVLTRDIFNLFVFFEILCIASYILVSWEQTGAALEAAFKYMVLGSIGSTFILVAIALAYKVAGSLAMADIAAAFATAPKGYAVLAGVLFLFGMGVEAAIFPVNTWLPDAHSSAPSSISAILSGFVIELSLVVAFRVLTTVFGALDLLPVFGVLALAGVLVGEFAAYSQTELKRALAYSSIGQIGVMLFALSLGTPEGGRAALQHLLMHSGAKSALFLSAGYFILRTGNRDIGAYRGLGRRMPVTGALFALAALSLIGLPPLFGFFTKFQVLSAAAAQNGALAWIGIAVILLGTILEAVYFFRVVRTLFSADDAAPATDRAKSYEMEWPALAAVALFAALVVFGALLLPTLSAVMGPMADGLSVLN